MSFDSKIEYFHISNGVRRRASWLHSHTDLGNDKSFVRTLANTMNLVEKEIHETLYKNALIFFKDGIERLVSKDNDSKNLIEYDLLILTCTSIQIALELAIKALIVKKRGLNFILNEKHKRLTFDELYNLFKKNKIKTKEFDNLKNFIKSEKLIESLNKNDFKIISDFQDFRNGIAHFTYNFLESDGDFYNLKDNIVNYCIHILTKILIAENDEFKPSEFYSYTLGTKYEKLLLSYSPFCNAMSKLAHKNSEKVFNCIRCNNLTYAKSEKYCYCCNFYAEEENGCEFIDCDYCKEEESVLFDSFNIIYNKNEIRGICLNCHDDAIIFKCPKCGIAHNIETTLLDEKCTNEKCTFYDE